VTTLLADAPLLVTNTLESVPQEQLLSSPRLVNLKSNVLIQLGDIAGAYRTYHQLLTQKTAEQWAMDTIVGYGAWRKLWRSEKNTPKPSINYARTHVFGPR
jgi:hypothetical protein